MTIARAYRITLLILMILGMVQGVYAQAAIVPKPNPILHLDKDGNYTTKLEDVAVIVGAASYTRFWPESFDCDQVGVGPQSVFVAISMQNSRVVSFNHPAGLAFNASGDLYVSEIDGQKIRKITAAGVVTTFAGSGTIGFTNGRGTAATFNNPNGLAVDNAGNIYVADGGNHVIRKISPTGIVITFAGNGNRGNTDGAGTAASFAQPTSLAFDGDGNLFVTDEFNDNIRKIDPDGNVTTLAGSGFPGYRDGQGKDASFALPYGLTIDGIGNLYVTDIQNYRVRKITPQGLVSTVAGNGVQANVDGTGTNAGFANAYGITNDGFGNLFVFSGAQIRKITSAGVVTTFAGKRVFGSSLDGTDTLSRFHDLNNIITDASGNMYAADIYNNNIRIIAPSSAATTLAGDGTQATQNGNIGPIATINQREMQIQVTIAARLLFTEHPADIDINYLGCEPILRDYFPGNRDSCALAITRLRPKFYTATRIQTPPAGTLLQNEVPTKITITISDNFYGADTVSFNVTAHNGRVNQPTTVKIKASANPVCTGIPVTFSADIINPPISRFYKWLINGEFVGYDPTYTATNLQVGDQVVCVVGNSNSTCFLPASSDPFIVAIVPPPTLSFGKSPFIEPGSSVQLNPVTTGDVASYKWSPATALSNTAIANPVASPIETTTYQLQITGPGGCQVTDSVTVRVDPDLHIPNAFSPNGDGVNDTWVIKSLLPFAQCTVAVYNRNGQLVFSSTGYGRAWDGTYSGTALPMGTYYYVIKPTPNRTEVGGYVTIIR